jgi:pimeloyl-ACP methyl ester carboxylesterase
MAVFVLVHGGWGGGWEWRGVADRLRAAGHDAYRPTLTGLGERSHLLSAEVTLDTHVEDVVQLLRFEDLRDVVLCGHSYGGMVVTGAADREPRRVAQLVYVDALVPRDGDALLDLLPEEWAETIRRAAAGSGDGRRVPVPFSHEETAALRGRWYADRVTAHPLAAFEQPLRLRGAGDPIPRTYIHCTGEADSPASLCAERARAAGWRYRELATHHDAQIGDPDGLTALLLEAAG